MPAEAPAPQRISLTSSGAPRRHAGQVHLDDGLAPLVALDDRGGEAHALELGHLERDPARRRGEAALVGSLVRARADELVGLLVQHRVDGLLAGSPNDMIGLDVACLLS